MHPKIEAHPKCRPVYDELMACYEKHYINKFFGRCANLKYELERCMTEDYYRIKENARKNRSQVKSIVSTPKHT